jgi:hypothetical protein
MLDLIVQNQTVHSQFVRINSTRNHTCLMSKGVFISGTFSCKYFSRFCTLICCRIGPAMLINLCVVFCYDVMLNSNQNSCRSFQDIPNFPVACLSTDSSRPTIPRNRHPRYLKAFGPSCMLLRVRKLMHWQSRVKVTANVPEPYFAYQRPLIHV